MDIAGVIQARLASQRCKRKNLRPFAGSNLVSIALGKFSKSKEITRLYFAAYEEELIGRAKEFDGVTIVRRTKESAYGEDIPTVLSYVHNIKEEFVAFVDTSTPFLRLETFDRAMDYFRRNSFKSMMSVSPTYNWYFDDQHNLLNKDPNVLGGNTKMLQPLYKASAAFLVANRERILKEHTYWSLTKDDPALYVIDEREAFDIDTESDFELAEVLYTHAPPK